MKLNELNLPKEAQDRIIEIKKLRAFGHFLHYGSMLKSGFGKYISEPFNIEISHGHKKSYQIEAREVICLKDAEGNPKVSFDLEFAPFPDDRCGYVD